MITRRSFIRGIAAGATLAVVGMSPALAAQKTITTDIVVVGAGSSGLAAAVQAAEKGAKVVLLEKNPFVGGNSQHAEGLFAVESEYQRLRSDPQTVKTLSAATLNATNMKWILLWFAIISTDLPKTSSAA